MGQKTSHQLGVNAGSEISGPIFVVGPSRSGTELMRSILNQHPGIHIAQETHYFDDLRPRIKRPHERLVGDERDLALKYFSLLYGSAYGLFGNENKQGQSEFYQLAQGATDMETATADQLFQWYCQLGNSGKAIWGEKTPRHIYRAADIFSAFPSAKIIVMIRDPRATALSYRDWKNNYFAKTAMSQGLAEAVKKEEKRTAISYNLTLNVLLWKSAAKTAQRLLQEFGPLRIVIVKLEDVLSRPAQEIARICNFIGVTPHEAMTSISIQNSSFQQVKSQQGFVAESISRWKTGLSPAEIQHVARIAGKTMQEFGYALEPGKKYYGFSLLNMTQLCLQIPKMISANYHRIASLTSFIGARLLALVGR